ncbi:hypothetical protein CLPUN_14190 [Clostridium puniceum]|uniref:Uncharacterized protein n=1 Tax=Clostridium puniceum TaxID=29367 RepID=A0A1S8TQ83_9CLOT|nr:hypothetical protein CLPUN_14190 [Clostridium puniceum]
MGFSGSMLNTTALDVVGCTGGSVFLVTLTVHDALKLLPSVVVAFIITLPSFIAVSLPVKSTVAIDLSLEVHVTFLLVALYGITVATKLSTCPICKLAVTLFSDIPDVTIGCSPVSSISIASSAK